MMLFDKLKPFGAPPAEPVQPVDLNPPEPKYPAPIIDRAQRMYAVGGGEGQGSGKAPPVSPVPPTAIPAGGRWGSGK
jgi:hypothetical protein